LRYLREKQEAVGIFRLKKCGLQCEHVNCMIRCSVQSQVISLLGAIGTIDKL